MSSISFFGRLQKVNGQLIYCKDKDAKAYEEFKKILQEGDYIELYAEQAGDDGTLAQLAKVHAMIHELSRHTGYTFSETKMLIKEKAGLCLIREQAGREIFLCASFGDCDKDELSAAIKACYEMGEETGHPLM